ncbi:MAG: RNA 2',3'-cyclic phosphodiesterase [Anaerolineae bacterium]
MNLRLFVAVELPQPVVDALSEAQQGLKCRLGSQCVRWSDPRGTHLTLKFLGDTDEARVPDIESALTETCASFTAGKLRLSCLGVFPSLQRPRVIWAGLDGDDSSLASLQAAIETALARLGFPAEGRPFSPHLTLGRVRDGASTADYDAIAAALSAAPAVVPATLGVDEVSLMRSVLKPQGAEYTRLFAVTLARGHAAT